MDVQDEKLKAEEAEKAAKEAAEKGEEAPAPKAAEPINDTHPPVAEKSPRLHRGRVQGSFYHKLFHTFDEPLFWIHLNVDYPFNLKGILYFPELTQGFRQPGGADQAVQPARCSWRITSRRVIPEFLLLLQAA